MNFGSMYEKVVLIPIGAILLLNFLIINNILMLITTSILYNCGMEVYKSKEFTSMKLFFMIFIPNEASIIHESIILYRDFYQRYLKNKKLIAKNK